MTLKKAIEVLRQMRCALVPDTALRQEQYEALSMVVWAYDRDDEAMAVIRDAAEVLKNKTKKRKR